MKKISIKLLKFIFAITLLSVSCNEENVTLPDEGYINAQDNIYSERIISEAFDIINAGISTYKFADDCPTFEWNSNLLTITYPADGCTGSDGIERSGIINARFNVDFNGVWAIEDSVTVTYEDYTMNGNSITGTFILTCTSTQPKVFRLTSENMLITASNSNTISWETIMDYTLLEGGGTFDISDDKWQIDGTTSGIGTNGKSFTREEIELIKVSDCKFFISGHLILSIDNTDTYDIEFLSQCGVIYINYNGFQFPMYME